MPSAKPRANASLGLEVWAIGGWDELVGLRSQLAAAGRLIEVGNPSPLVGPDAGRYRQYIRVHVRSREGT
ncbi:hypothetical protein ACQEUV_26605 [Micromonospora aurantiaca (nom. illeg.)]|uniref:hypothetical protein n=1 Tax=Micromonospora aurantiaca (nom. illeg.) TaxID=47850 RepID=UPI003DA3D802